MLVMTRTLAERVFTFQTSPDFLFDLEISLIANANGIREVELPVTLHLAQEKTISRMFHETLHILLGLPFLALRLKKGAFGQKDDSRLGVNSRFLHFSADDWGISPGVNDGILDLVKSGMVRRVSLLADGKFVGHELPALLKLQEQGRVSLGLHYNLTYGKRHRSPGAFLRQWFLAHFFWFNSELRGYVRDELLSQLGRLRAMGVTQIQYLDGHHHIHIVPGLLGALHDILKQAQVNEIRLPYSGALWFSRRWSLAVMALLARRKFTQYGFQYRKFFYPSNRHFLDPGYFASALARHNVPTEVIVHPAARADAQDWEYPDSYISPRVTEFLTLRMLSTVFQNEGPIV